MNEEKKRSSLVLRTRTQHKSAIMSPRLKKTSARLGVTTKPWGKNNSTAEERKKKNRRYGKRILGGKPIHHPKPQKRRGCLSLRDGTFTQWIEKQKATKTSVTPEQWDSIERRRKEEICKMPKMKPDLRRKRGKDQGGRPNYL